MSEPSSHDERALLDELGLLHRAERAPDSLRRSLLEQARRRSQRAPSNTRARWSLPALAALVLGVVMSGLLAGKLLDERPRAGVIVQAEPSRAASEPSPPVECLVECPDYPGMRDAAALLRTTERDVLLAGLQAHSVEQPTRQCGVIERRYLSYVPPSLPLRSAVPVLLVLHGGPDRAEGMWAIQTRRRFDVLASRNSFIVVYANAVPGHGTDPLLPRLPNEGRWHVQEDVSKAVDDEEYLQLVVEDLLRREVIDGRNDIYLVGHAEGAMMALQAAAHRPDFYTGVAALMPYYQASPPTLLHDARLSKVLFVALDDLGTRMAQHWALALGIPQSSIDASELGALPDRVKEGFDYELDGSMPLSTRDSTVELMDLRSPEPKGPNVRMFDVHRASHFWPNPTADDDERLVDSVGFRNQDIDGADETWRFFSGRGLPPLQPNDDAAPEPANDAPN